MSGTLKYIELVD